MKKFGFTRKILDDFHDFVSNNNTQHTTTTPLRGPATVSWWRGLAPVRFAPDGEARSRPGVTVAGAPPVQRGTGQNYYMSRAELSYLSSAESPTSSSRCSCCEMLVGPMQYLGAVVLRPAGVGVGGSAIRAMLRRRRRWAAWHVFL